MAGRSWGGLAGEQATRQGSMRTRCTITLIVGLVTALVAALPAVAPAGPLLSGYSGPGQGSQAILGSALLNGPPPAGGSPSTTTSSSSGSTTGTAAPHQRGGARGHSGKAAGHASGRRPAPVAGAPSAYAANSSNAAATSDTLGLSGKDLLYILLALGVLTFAGLSTRWLTRRPGQQGTNS